MARAATNTAKRDEMKSLIAAALEAGWTRGQIAAAMGVTPSTVSAWGNGNSMGTNAQRAQLKTFTVPGSVEVGRKSVEDGLARAKERVAKLEADLARTRAQLEALAVDGVARSSEEEEGGEEGGYITVVVSTGEKKYHSADGKVTYTYNVYSWPQREIRLARAEVERLEKVLAKW